MIRRASIPVAMLVVWSAASAQPPKRLAIYDFDYSAVLTQAQAIFGTQVNVGRGINALLANNLASAQAFTIIERSKLDAVLQEQTLAAKSRAPQGVNPRTAGVPGVDLVLMGDITAFGRDDRHGGVTLGGRYCPKVLTGVRFGKKEDKAVVAIAYRLVDPNTGEVLISGEARGESTRKSKGIGGLVSVGHGLGLGGLDMASSGFQETIIGEATSDAVKKLAADLNRRASVLPAKELEMTAQIADADGSRVVLNVGARAGVRVGDRFEVARVKKEIRDPVTNVVIDLMTERVGEAVVTQITESIAVASYTGPAGAKIGDTARRL